MKPEFFIGNKSAFNIFSIVKLQRITLPCPKYSIELNYKIVHTNDPVIKVVLFDNNIEILTDHKACLLCELLGIDYSEVPAKEN